MLPNNWTRTTIGSQITLQRGIDITRVEQRDGTIPVISSGGISSFHDTAAVSGPGVVLGRKGVIGSVYYIDRDYWPHDTALWVKNFHNNLPRFVYYFFKYLTPTISSMDVGSANPTLNRNHVHLLHTIWPPLPEQRAIAGILGALDDKIEVNRRMNVTLEGMAGAVFREMTKDVGEQGSILEFANLLSGGTPKTSEADYWNGNIEWVSAKDVSNADGVFLLDTEKKITQAGIDNSATKLLPAKTVIVTARGTVGANCILGKPMTMNQTNYGLKAKEGIGDYFVYFTLSNMVEQLKQQSYGTIFDTITTKIFQTAQCAHPSLEVIQNFESQVVPMMKAILNNQKESRTLASLRDSLLPRLMRGEIRVGA